MNMAMSEYTAHNFTNQYAHFLCNTLDLVFECFLKFDFVLDDELLWLYN